jgi:hypothetical protein
MPARKPKKVTFQEALEQNLGAAKEDEDRVIEISRKLKIDPDIVRTMIRKLNAGEHVGDPAKAIKKIMKDKENFHPRAFELAKKWVLNGSNDWDPADVAATPPPTAHVSRAPSPPPIARRAAKQIAQQAEATGQPIQATVQPVAPPLDGAQQEVVDALKKVRGIAFYNTAYTVYKNDLYVQNKWSIAFKERLDKEVYDPLFRGRMNEPPLPAGWRPSAEQADALHRINSTESFGDFIDEYISAQRRLGDAWDVSFQNEVTNIGDPKVRALKRAKLQMNIERMSAAYAAEHERLRAYSIRNKAREELIRRGVWKDVKAQYFPHRPREPSPEPDSPASMPASPPPQVRPPPARPAVESRHLSSTGKARCGLISIRKRTIQKRLKRSQTVQRRR